MPAAFKMTLLTALKSKLAAELASIEAATLAAHAAATSEESRPENKYDTRGLEASYLAAGQEERAAGLRADLQRLAGMELRLFAPDAAITAGAVTLLAQGSEQSWYFMLALGGGYTLSAHERTVTTISPLSPLGRALIGKKCGDFVTVTTRQSEKEYEILHVS